MKKMIFAKISLFLLGALPIAFAESNTIPNDFSLRLISDKTELLVLAINNSTKKIRVAYPFRLSVGEDMGGLEFAFYRINNNVSEEKPSKLCAFIDGPEESFPREIPLYGHSVLGEKFSFSHLKEFHCLNSGTYDMVVKYHNVVGVTKLTDYVPEARMRITFADNP